MIRGLLLGALLWAGIFWVLWPASAECSWCPQSPCITSAACHGCICVSRGDGQQGRCVSLD